MFPVKRRQVKNATLEPFEFFGNDSLTPRLLCAAALAFAVRFSAVDADAQGFINFYNGGHNLFAYVTDSRTGERLSGRGWLGQLYYSPEPNASESALVPAPGPSVYFGRAGYFDISQDFNRFLADAPLNERITVQLRAWNAAAGMTYEEAAASPIGVVGKSIVGSSSVTAPGYNPGFLHDDMQPFAVYPVPEPPASIVIAIGIACVVFFKCRRNIQGFSS